MKKIMVMLAVGALFAGLAHHGEAARLGPENDRAMDRIEREYHANLRGEMDPLLRRHLTDPKEWRHPVFLGGLLAALIAAGYGLLSRRTGKQKLGLWCLGLSMLLAVASFGCQFYRLYQAALSEMPPQLGGFSF